MLIKPSLRSLASLLLFGLLSFSVLSVNVAAQEALADRQVRLGHAEGLRAIKRIQHAYAQYLGAGRWQTAAALFTETGELQDGEDSASGHEEISEFLASRYGDDNGELSEGMLNAHLHLSPVISIEAGGRSALGRWRLVSLQGQLGVEAKWQGGIFENRYELEDGHWRIAQLSYHPVYGGDYAQGWRILEEETADSVEPIPFHFTPDSAGIPWPEPNAESLQSAGETAATVVELDARAARLLDEDRVVRLQNAWGYYRDRQMWDDLADLWHESGSLSIGEIGTYEGQNNIRAALAQFGAQPLPADRINEHLQLQIVVSVSADGKTATARGTELQMLGEHGVSAHWGLSTFENRYEKVAGQWQIRDVRVYPRMLSDYASGWGKAALPSPPVNADYPAELPASTHTAVYPALDLPGFSFDEAIARAQPQILPAADEAENQQQALTELDRKLRILNAYDGAENVSNAYGYYIDEFLWDNMADVFSLNGWKELSYIGIYDGRERVRQSVVSRYGRSGRRANSMTYHQKTQPVITVAEDGRSAQIRTRLFQLNSARDNPGSYNSGIYENRVINEDGIWKIRSMDLDYAWRAGYDGGWQAVEPASSQGGAPDPDALQGEQAPDRPLRGLTFPPYPLAPVDMAFHYRNPVSGREPPIFLPAVYAAEAEAE